MKKNIFVYSIVIRFLNWAYCTILYTVQLIPTYFLNSKSNPRINYRYPAHQWSRICISRCNFASKCKAIAAPLSSNAVCNWYCKFSFTYYTYSTIKFINFTCDICQKSIARNWLIARFMYWTFSQSDGRIGFRLRNINLFSKLVSDYGTSVWLTYYRYKRKNKYRLLYKVNTKFVILYTVFCSDNY